MKDAISEALATGVAEGGALRSSVDAGPAVPWRPRGVLVAHLAEHKKCVFCPASLAFNQVVCSVLAGNRFVECEDSAETF